MKKALTLTGVMLCALLLLAAFAPKTDDPIDKIVAALQRWTDKNPQEKIYLQTDKPYYALGDTIWFKGYLMAGSKHQLSALSGAMYVDLVTEQDSVIRSLKLPVTAGMVMGDFILADDFKDGSYRLRAYTRWMRNAGEEYFFDRTIAVASVANQGVNGKVDYKYLNEGNKPELQATLTYTDDAGKPLANKSVEYRIMVNRKVVWTKSTQTDANGSLLVSIANNDKVDLRGAFIKTTIRNNANDKVDKDFPIVANLQQSDVQLFPEGGSLVNGINSRVGFKAVGINGSGVAIKGNVTDEGGNEVAQIQTMYAGMGSFNLRPEAGKTYTAKITFDDGSVKNLPLPKAQEEGFVLSVYQPNKDSVLIRVNASPKQAQNQPTLSLMAQAGGETVVATSFKVDKAITSIWLAKKDFPSGIAQFTLFNSNNEPLNERVAFLKNDDHLNLSLKTAKNSYKSKEQVQVLLNSTNSKGQPTFGNFSVSVINETKVPHDESAESTIFSNILLTSDLRGYIEKPNYYFTKAEGADKALDNLMLTQGYRRFVWKEVIAGNEAKPAFKVEGLGTTISGKVHTLGNKPMPGATVTLMAVKANVMLQTKADSLGRFKFDKIFATDSINFAIQANTIKGTDKAMIFIDSIPKVKLAKNRNIADVSTNMSFTLKDYIANAKKQDDLYEKLGQLDKVQRLREVRINESRKKIVDIAPQGMFRINSESADRTMVVRPEEAERFQTLAHYLQATLPAVRVTTGALASVSDSRSGAMQIILNGRKLGAEEAAEILDGGIQPEDVVKVDVVRTSLPIISLLGGPSLMLYTKNTYMRKQNNFNIANVKPKGFNKAREFYLPKYNKPESELLPDLRTTVYWNPYLKTDANGQAGFTYFNADGPGTYKVIVEGLNADGELGRQVFRYTVEAPTVTAFAPRTDNRDPVVKTISTALDTLRKKLPVEKVYLHTDKPYYNIGDTLWFKGYLVNGASLKPSAISRLLYVELANDTGQVVRRISVAVKGGTAWGQIPLTKEIFHEGGVTLRAYTNWMQNFGEDFVFTQRLVLGIPAADAWLVNSRSEINRVDDKDQLSVDLKLSRPDRSPLSMHKVEVRIYEDEHRAYYAENHHYIYKEQLLTGVDGSLKLSQMLKDKVDGRRMRVQIHAVEKNDGEKVIQVPLNIVRTQKVDVQFLPEGGQLVAGLTSVIGFKAINEDGKGASIIGEICDSKGIKVADFTSTHNGMGSFVFTPKAGETYSVKIIQPTTKVFDLPKVNSEGTVMRIANDETADNLSVSIQGAGNALLIDSAYYLVGTSRGAVYYSEKVNLSQPAINVAKNVFPTGVVHFNLFRGTRPLNQRIVFIDRKDGLSFDLKPNKPTHLKRDSIGLEIEVKDKTGLPVQGTFSLAVTDDSQVKPDSLGNNSIAASLLLNADLKGYIEEPGYYINRKDKEAWLALDNLLLTQGWTAYDWKDAFAPANRPVKFQAEKEFKVSGTVVNLSNKPVPFAEVLLSSQKPTFIANATADEHGRYVFNKLPVIDSGSFFVQANSKNGKSMSFGAITVDKVTFPKAPLTLRDQIMPWYVNPAEEQLNYVKRQAEQADEANLKAEGKMLRTVAIKAKKVIPGSLNPYGPGNADIVLDQKDIKASAVTNLYDLLLQKIPGIWVKDVGVHMQDGRSRVVPTLKFGSDKVVHGRDLLYDGLPLSLDVPTEHPTIDDAVDAMRNIPVANIKGIEVAYSSEYTARAILDPVERDPEKRKELIKIRDRDGANEGVIIIITTLSGAGWYDGGKSASKTSYRPLPVTRPQQFYSPRYAMNATTTGMPDYRPTIYWEPNITTDANGKAKVSFYSTDIPAAYTVNMQGQSADGNIGSLHYKLPAMK